MDATREAGDDIWFELVDGDNNQTYANANFRYSNCNSPAISNAPRNCASILNQAASNSTIGGTFVHASLPEGLSKRYGNTNGSNDSFSESIGKANAMAR